jgi:hypothetical protein
MRGGIVYFRPQKSIAPVDRRLPKKDGEFEYAIRSDYENHDRVARQSELTRPK